MPKKKKTKTRSPRATGRFSIQQSMLVDPAMDTWLASMGAGDASISRQKLAKYRIIDLAIQLARASLSEPIEFLEAWEREFLVTALANHRFDGLDAGKLWLVVSHHNEELGLKVRGLSDLEQARLLVHIIAARRPE